MQVIRPASQVDVRMGRAIEDWENEGGAAPPYFDTANGALNDTAAQVQWAELIRIRVGAEFDRLVTSFRAVAKGHRGGKRADLEAIVAIVEDTRHVVPERQQAATSSMTGRTLAIRWGR